MLIEALLLLASFKSFGFELNFQDMLTTVPGTVEKLLVIFGIPVLSGS